MLSNDHNFHFHGSFGKSLDEFRVGSVKCKSKECITIKRNHYNNIYKGLSRFKPMIFMAGPRQVGKTTLAKDIGAAFNNLHYFNYDIIENRKEIIENAYFYENLNRRDSSRPLIILDEIHKFYDWKNYIKGVYDRDADKYHFLILGSGRLNLYKKGGDSLAGRYLLLHLWPFTIGELAGAESDFKQFKANLLSISDKEGAFLSSSWKHLFELSGFPEPFLSESKEFYNIWSRNYSRQLLREDIHDIEQIKKSDQIALLFSLLPTRVGSPLSIDNIAGDISVSFDTAKSWLQIFDSFFLTFSITPYSPKISKSITKRKKIYMMDYVRVESGPIRFENMVALEIYRAVNNWNDSGWGDFSLHYVRNKQKEEVDFLIADRGVPIILVETKQSEIEPSGPLIKFQNMFQVPAVQLINKRDVYKIYSNGNLKTAVISAEKWLARLP